MGKTGHFFFAPRFYEIEHLSLLKEEVFGPCLHLIRFKGDQLEDVMPQINNTGFGLTMGIHSRIEGRANKLAKASVAGNIYINRNMIGAVVGVQPFGGRGLSGTGPKAGGPTYLKRLVKEKTSPENFQETTQSSRDVDFNCSAEDEKQVVKIMANSEQSEKAWRQTNLNDRISALRQLIAKVAAVESIDALADNLEQTLSDARTQLSNIEKRLAKPKILPGPTGESNTLHLEPRGCIVCYADKDTSINFWVLSIISALATGNTVVTVVSDRFHKEALAFREKFTSTGISDGVLQVARRSQLKAILAHPHLAGAVVGSGCQQKNFVNTELAARTGAILPVISSEYYDTLINRLLTEKTISIDTTASGGNTSLMTLTDDE
jgi:RHH-type proline utilization regulon transcriptional repressor/proline dehydrogenase/delta 1-pyrroline-5-carboxylate dehydrogenase